MRIIIMDDNVAHVEDIQDSLVEGLEIPADIIYYVGRDGELKTETKEAEPMISLKADRDGFLCNLTNALQPDDVILVDLALDEKEIKEFIAIADAYDPREDYSARITHAPKIINKILETKPTIKKIIVISSVYRLQSGDALKLFLPKNLRANSKIAFMRKSDILNISSAPTSREELKEIIS